MNTSRLKTIFFSGAALMCMPGLAAAQGNATTGDERPQADNDGGMREIVVTARRRAERLQEVPLAVQALSAADLSNRGLARAQDLIQTTPTLRSTPISGRRIVASYQLRGITSDEGLITQDAAIGIYFDEVYMPRPIGVNQNFYDMESVQVLFGPQGTLFGRNSTGGAILFQSKRPTDRFEGEVSAGYGNYDWREFTGVINVPIGDTLAVRLAGKRSLRDGYSKQIVYNNFGAIQKTKDIDNDNVLALRGSVRWQPGSAIENVFIGDFFRSRDRGTNYKLAAVRPCEDPGNSGIPATEAFSPTAGPPLSCFFGTTPSAFFGGAPVNAAAGANLGTFFDQFAQAQADGPRLNRSDVDTFSRAKAYGIANITTVDLSDQIVLKNVFGYRHSRYVSLADSDLTPLPIIVDGIRTGSSTSYSNELQLQGKSLDGNLDWIVGAYYFRERGSEDLPALVFPQLQPTPLQVFRAIGINKSASLFAQATYKFGFLDGLSATAGGRYTWDKRKLIQNSPTNSNPAVPGSTVCKLTDNAGTPLPLANCRREFGKSFDQPTYTVSLNYQANRETLFYLAHRLGYRSGGFNGRGATVLSVGPFKPEKTRDVEFGIKKEWDLGGTRAWTNIAVYKTWYDQIQRTVAIVENGLPASTVLNASKATIKGFELNAGIVPVEGVEISGFWGMVDGRYKNFRNQVLFDANGNPLPGAPGVDLDFPSSRHSYGVTATVTPINRPEIGKVTMTANWSWQSSFSDDHALPLVEPESRVPGQGLMNVSMDWDRIAGSPISAQAFIRNLFDKGYVYGNLTLIGQLGWSSRTYAEPRMYGLTLKYAFGD